jgi:hypothetical protein
MGPPPSAVLRILEFEFLSGKMVDVHQWINLPRWASHPARM